MKIVHICISERYEEGASYQENLLSKRHKDLGHDVYIIATQDYFDGKAKQTKHRPVANYINDSGIPVTILPNNHSFCYSSLLFDVTKGLFNKLEEINPDIIFVHGVTANDNRHVAKYAKIHSGVRVFADNHNDYETSPLTKRFSRLKSWIQSCHARFLLPCCETFWGTIPLRVEYLNKIYRIPTEKTDFLVMGGDERIIEKLDIETTRVAVRKQYGIPEDAFLVITGGAFDQRKQQYLLMEAISKLNNNKIWLLAFGEPVQEMKETVEQYRNVPNIVFTGWVLSSKAYELFIASDLAFFPGHHSVLWEQATACGLPIVVKRARGTEHVSVNGNAVLMDDVTPDSIASLISELSFTEKYNKMKKNALEAAPLFYLSNVALKAIGLQPEVEK